jgi:hypothetical protein
MNRPQLKYHDSNRQLPEEEKRVQKGFPQQRQRSWTLCLIGEHEARVTSKPTEKGQKESYNYHKKHSPSRTYSIVNNLGNIFPKIVPKPETEEVKQAKKKQEIKWKPTEEEKD